LNDQPDIGEVAEVVPDRTPFLDDIETEREVVHDPIVDETKEADREMREDENEEAVREVGYTDLVVDIETARSREKVDRV